MSEYTEFLKLAVSAAEEAGAMIRDNFETDLNVDEMHAHDIKLELDVKSQELIFERLTAAFPDHALYGEEGIGGNQSSEYQWIVDPIDGTVNFFYGIPHFCVSIALRLKDEIIVGVIYDPMMRELYAVERGGKPTRNGKPISVSNRSEMKQAILTLGFSKTRESMDAGLERYRQLAYEVRKTRMMGSAALAMAYIACGRLDGYIEEQISIWDIAAGWLLIEMAGGEVIMKTAETDPDKSSIVAWNGKLPLAKEL